MIEFRGRAVLLDIEGTTSSVTYVYDVLFPYALKELAPFLGDHWKDPEVQRACDLITRDADGRSYADWQAELGDLDAYRKLLDEIERLTKADVKSTGLKQLQGLIWREGYQKGELISHVYPDVPEALKRWQQAGLTIAIYSSGSVLAQKQFFSHTEYGNLTRFFQGHYDTTTGPKRETRSYTAIARDLGLPPPDVLFCSDVVAELDAARGAGMQTALMVRPGNAPQLEGHVHPVIESLEEVQV